MNPNKVSATEEFGEALSNILCSADRCDMERLLTAMQFLEVHHTKTWKRLLRFSIFRTIHQAIHDADPDYDART